MIPYQELEKFYDNDNNKEQFNHTISLKSGKLYLKCDKNHTWLQRMCDLRTNKITCPYCSCRKVLTGFNDAETFYPDIIKIWNYDKNNITPKDITYKSTKKVWWTCNKGHEYYKSIADITVRGQRCYYCSGKRVLQGFNDLETEYPNISKQWNYDKNPDNIDPTKIRKGSNKKYWWNCNNDHYYECSVTNRVQGYGCPYCSGRKAWKGENDLLSQYPELVKDSWDYDKNTIEPDKVTYGSDKKVWWKCNLGHSWKSHVYSRKKGHDCPTCSKSRSKLEIEIFEYIKSIIPGVNIINNYKNNNISEIDIYIPDKNIGIEVNGIFWHSSKSGRKDPNKHYNKWLKCKKENIQLLTIWEDDWRNNTVLVKNMLKHKLNVSDDKKVYARNTSICKKPVKTIKSFLSINHIQSFGVGTINLCLSYNDDLVAVSTWIFDRKKKILTLDRYATSCIVVGGFSKLLKQGIQLARELDAIKIVTYSDHEISNGELYSKTGFVNDGIIKPSYYYIQNNGRVHKSNFRKSRFKNDPLLKYEDGLTEKQLAEINCLPIVYDCGKTRWNYNIE